MSVTLFAFLRVYTTQRDILIWQDENKDHAKKRFIKQAIPASAQAVTSGVSEVHWGWTEISKMFVSLCLVSYEPALDPSVFRDNCANLTQSAIIYFSGKDCGRDEKTYLITLPMEIMSCLTQACSRTMVPPHLTGDFDADTPIYPGWQEPNPIDLHAYEAIGLAIMNVRHLVPPGRRTSPYHIPGAIGTLVGEVPAIAINLRDPQQVRFAYRSTSLLRVHYGAVRLVSNVPLDERWKGQTGRQNTTSMLQTTRDISSEPPENLSTQRLAPLVNLVGKNTAIPQLFRKQCKDSRFQGVTVLSSEHQPFLSHDFTYASVWEEATPSFSASVNHFTPQCYPFLSESSLNALAFLPLSLKQNVKPPVQAWYLAGVGSDDNNITILDKLGHPYAGVLAALPQTLVVAAMLRHYIDNRETYNGPIHNHFDSLYANVIETSPGIVDSWTYFGTRGSFFPFHQEDALLPSANLMVMGEPKVWIFVTDSGMELLRVRMANYLQPCYMLHRSIFFHPEFLAQNSIPFTIAVQSEGELILADARSGHQGWNMGPNLAEAVNYADLPAMEYQKEELVRDGMAVWPCVCGNKPAPTDSNQKQALPGKETVHPFSLYRPEWDTDDDLGCSALYQWVETLTKQIDPTSPFFISAKHLLDLRSFVYQKADEKCRVS